MAKHRVIGKALRKVDAVAKVTGATRFADDLAFPRMLYCRLLRSTEPHARIVSIDVTAATQLAACRPFSRVPICRSRSGFSPSRRTSTPSASTKSTSSAIPSQPWRRQRKRRRLPPSISSRSSTSRSNPSTRPKPAVAHPEPQIHDYAGPRQPPQADQSRVRRCRGRDR